MIKVNIKETVPITGIYLIQYPNNKVYIGQSQNIHLRILEHNNRARNLRRGDGKAPQLCDRKIKEYFPNGVQSYYILEKCNIEELDIKEEYWIKKYNALDKKKGYNFLDKGNVSGRRGVDNANASLNKQQLDEIIDLLINRYDLSYKDIALQMNVSVGVIQNICWGKTYVQSELKYPLRKNVNSFHKKELLDYFQSEKELIELKEDLKYRWDLKIENDLVNKYNIPLSVLRDINQGRKFFEYGEYQYPIRAKNIRNQTNLSIDDVKNIINRLRSTDSITSIAKDFNITRNTVYSINNGKSYIIKGEIYPIRELNK